MASSEMLRCVALIRTEGSEELNASIIRVPIIGELGTLTVTNKPTHAAKSIGISSQRASVVSYS
jgi:hypothetical protein